MSQFNYISTCVEPTSVNDGVSCRFLKKNSVNLVLVKHNIVEVYSVKNIHKSSFLADEVSSADRSLVIQKKYYSKDKITAIKAVRPYGGMRDNLLILNYSTNLILLKYDRKVNDIVTVASAFVGTHMYPFSEVEHLCCITYDHAYAALRLNCELVKVIRLEPIHGSRRLESKSFHIDDSVIVNMGFIPDENDRVLLAMLTERGIYRYITVYELLFGSVQAVRMFGAINKGLDLETTQLLTFNYFNSGAVVLSSGMISYYHDNGVHTFMSPFLKRGSIVSSCVLNPYDEATIIIAVNDEGNVYQITRVRDNLEAPFAVQTIGVIPCAQKLIHIEDGLIFACSSTGNSFLFHVKEHDGNVICDFVDIHPGYGPIIDMLQMRSPSSENNGLLLCSGAGLDGTLRVLNDGFETTEKYVIDIDQCQNIWVMGPFVRTENRPQDSLSSFYSIVLSLSHTTMLFEMFLHDGTCVKLPPEVADTITLYAVELSSQSSSTIRSGCDNPLSWIQVTPDHVAVVSCLDSYQTLFKWTPPSIDEKILSSSSYFCNLLAVATNSGIHIVNISNNLISYVSFIAVERVQNVALSYSAVNISSKFVAYNCWGENKIHVSECMSNREVACAIIPKAKFINSLCLIASRSARNSRIFLFSTLTNGNVNYCDILLDENLMQNSGYIEKAIEEKISVQMSMNSQLSIVHLKQLQRLFVVSYGDNTVFIELDYTLISDSSRQDNDCDLSNFSKSFITKVNHLNLSNIRSLFLSPNDDKEIITLQYNAIVFSNLNYESHYFVSKSLNLFETPVRVCYQSESNSIVLLTSEPVTKNSGGNCVRAYYNKLLVQNGLRYESEVEKPVPISQYAPVTHRTHNVIDEDPEWEWMDIPSTYKLVVFDMDTLYPTYTHCFGESEDVIALESLHFGHQNSFPYYVTTSNIGVNPVNITYRGFVKLYQIKNDELSHLDTISINGLVLSVIAFHGKLVVGVSGQLYLYEINKNDKMVLLNQFECGIIPAFFKVYNNELLVGDIMNNITIMEMVDKERGVLKITLQSDMPGWATSAHILNNGMYMNSNIEKCIHIFTKERVFKSATITKLIDQIDQDDDVDIKPCFVDDENDPNMYRLIDDESRKKILDDNPKRYRVVAKHYTGEHITSICDGPSRPLFSANRPQSSGDSSYSHARAILDKFVKEISSITNELPILPTTGQPCIAELLSYKPSYTVLLSSSSGSVKLFFELSPEQFALLFEVQRKLVRYHKCKRKSSNSVNRNNDLIYTKNLKKFSGGSINGDILRHVFRLPRQDVLQLLSDIPLCSVNPLTKEPLYPSEFTTTSRIRHDNIGDEYNAVNESTSSAVINDGEKSEKNKKINSEPQSLSNDMTTSVVSTPKYCYPPEVVFQLLNDISSLI